MTKVQSTTPRRKTITTNKKRSSNIVSSSTSDSESSNVEIKKQQSMNSKMFDSTMNKTCSISNDKKTLSNTNNSLSSVLRNSKQKSQRRISVLNKKSISMADEMKPIIKIPKISFEIS